MKKKLLISLLLIISLIQIQAARPSNHATNLSITNLSCRSLQINWTNGNGSARLIVGREGFPTNWAPSDNMAYSSNSHFGKGTDNGSGNFIVYNSSGNNSISIDSLKPGKTYYFTLYEHDNNGANTLYLTNGAPAINDLTFYLNINFNINVADSCEAHNSFTFNNTSSSNIPGLSYLLYYGDGNSTTILPANHQYIYKSGKIDVMLTAPQSLGCVNTITKPIRIYPKKVASFDLTKFIDTQCLIGNYFETDPIPLISSLPKSVYYNWSYGDGTRSTFKRMRKTYSKAGHYYVELETVIAVNLTPTACKDTLKLELEVLPAPMPQLGNDTIIYTNQKLKLDAGEANRYLWNSADTGRFLLIDSKIAPSGISEYSVIATNTIGCKGYDTITVTIDKNSFIISNKHSSLKLFPNPVIKVLNIDNPASEVFEWSVFSIEGKDIMSGNHSNAQIDFSDKMTGTYLLEIRSANSIRKVKIIKL